jgi:hypothetical protein
MGAVDAPPDLLVDVEAGEDTASVIQGRLALCLGHDVLDDASQEESAPPWITSLLFDAKFVRRSRYAGPRDSAELRRPTGVTQATGGQQDRCPKRLSSSTHWSDVPVSSSGGGCSGALANASLTISTSRSDGA